MSKSFRELGVSRPVVDALASREDRNALPIQELVLPDALAGWTSSRGRRPARARRWRSPCRSWSGSRVTAGFRRRSCSFRRASSRSRSTAEIEALAKAEGPARRRRLRRHALDAAGQAREARRRARRDARPAQGSRRSAGSSTSAACACSCSTRPTACSTWASSRRWTDRPPAALDRQTMFFSATLDGEVGELARAYTNSPSASKATRCPTTPATIDHHFVAVTTDDEGRDARRASARVVSRPWSSSARSAAPSGSSRSSPATG